MTDDIYHRTRNLIRGATKAALAVTSPLSTTEIIAQPYVSLVLTAFTGRCKPILFISDLAEHTKTLRQNPYCSLLIDGTGTKENLLMESRLTLQGQANFIHKNDAKDYLSRYFMRHPSAMAYQYFSDFHCVIIKPYKAHLVAGFGQIDWMNWDEIIAPIQQKQQASLSEISTEHDIIAHMNEDHIDILSLIAQKLHKKDQMGWRLTGIDHDGCDLKLGKDYIRHAFDHPVFTPNDVRKAFIKAAQKARENQ